MRTYKLKDGEVTGKDMSVMRENDKTKEQHQKTTYELRDYSLKHKVRIERDLNADATRDLIFRLIVDETEVLLDAEQVGRIIRWI